MCIGFCSLLWCFPFSSEYFIPEIFFDIRAFTLWLLLLLFFFFLKLCSLCLISFDIIHKPLGLWYLFRIKTVKKMKNINQIIICAHFTRFYIRLATTDGVFRDLLPHTKTAILKQNEQTKKKMLCAYMMRKRLKWNRMWEYEHRIVRIE